MPWHRGINESTVASIETQKIGILTDLFKKIDTITKISKIHVDNAVSKGAKFAYPKGVKLKYEKVLRHGSPSGLAKFNTAPNGSASNMIAITLIESKINFFIMVSLLICLYVYYIC